VAWTSLNKELLWPYTSSNGTCTSTIYGALSGLAVKLSSGATAVYPSSDETAFKTASHCLNMHMIYHYRLFALVSSFYYIADTPPAPPPAAPLTIGLPPTNPWSSGSCMKTCCYSSFNPPLLLQAMTASPIAFIIAGDTPCPPSPAAPHHLPPTNPPLQAVTASPAAFYYMADSAFMSYKGGVYTSTACTTAVNHASKGQLRAAYARRVSAGLC
jgi:hypothetical protein